MLLKPITFCCSYFKIQIGKHLCKIYVWRFKYKSNPLLLIFNATYQILAPIQILRENSLRFHSGNKSTSPAVSFWTYPPLIGTLKSFSFRFHFLSTKWTANLWAIRLPYVLRIWPIALLPFDRTSHGTNKSIWKKRVHGTILAGNKEILEACIAVV